MRFYKSGKNIPRPDIVTLKMDKIAKAIINQSEEEEINPYTANRKKGFNFHLKRFRNAL